eukprot:TRINITY_DN581_c0_g2_i1.p1 TRINITY_DN581_c0_g2~~TRINITY_DN581_c0_g2_i1.p1  ORF type:complete len:1327 (-),score=320.26 TRINITY_DN581_c0_g2_i1:960-4940(-)
MMFDASPFISFFSLYHSLSFALSFMNFHPFVRLSTHMLLFFCFFFRIIVNASFLFFTFSFFKMLSSLEARRPRFVLKKVIQKRVLSFLSTRWGVAVVVVGSFLALNLALLLLYALFVSEETKQSLPTSICPARCSHDFKDNIADFSFEYELCAPAIDVVFTWVNGSDPNHIKQLEKWKKIELGLSNSDDRKAENARKSEEERQTRNSLEKITDLLKSNNSLHINTEKWAHNSTVLDETIDRLRQRMNETCSDNSFNGDVDDNDHNGGSDKMEEENDANDDKHGSKGDDRVDPNRFRDNNELLFSLRSIEKHAPWVRKIFLVTNGQVPSWLDSSHPRVQVVTHEEIFVNKSHLPTFSSPAIESHLHRIPGLSDEFLYLNDDIMFGQDVWPDDFRTFSKGYKVFLAWNIPNCADGCPDSWIGDGFCDRPCNCSACNFDGGDCIGASASSSSSSGSNWWNQWNTASNKNKRSEQCAPGCPDSWVGDRFCDRSCKNIACGFDGTDCGLELMQDEMPGVIFEHGMKRVHVPSGAPSFYFDLSVSLLNCTVAEGKHNRPDLIRTSTVSQRHKFLTLTFHRNVTGDASIEIFGRGLADPASAPYASECSFVVNVTVDTKNQDYVFKNESASPLVIEAGDLSGSLDQSFPPDDDEKFSQDVAQAVLSVLRRRKNRKFDDASSLTTTSSNETVAAIIQEVVKDIVEQSMRNASFGATKREETPIVVVNGTDNFLNMTSENFSAGEIPDESAHENDGVSTKIGKREFHATDEDLDILCTKDILSRKLLDLERMDKGIVPYSSEIPDVWKFHVGRKSFDAFADSLRFANQLFSRDFGSENRKVLAHMPHFINKHIMERLQKHYSKEFDATSSHRFRGSNDMQYAFSYFYYLMSERNLFKLDEYFCLVLDVDGDGRLGRNEIRTMATFLSAVSSFKPSAALNQMILKNESLSSSSLSSDNSTHIDSANLPTSSPFSSVSTAVPTSSSTTSFSSGQSWWKKRKKTVDSIYMAELMELLHFCQELAHENDITLLTIQKCDPVVESIERFFNESQMSKKNRFEIVSLDDVTFEMLHENETRMLEQLDGVRRGPRKFICLNDNMESGNAKSFEYLDDFYRSMYPHPSSFELGAGGRKNHAPKQKRAPWREGMPTPNTAANSSSYGWLWTLFAFLICISFLWMTSRWWIEWASILRLLLRPSILPHPWTFIRSRARNIFRHRKRRTDSSSSSTDVEDPHPAHWKRRKRLENGEDAETELDDDDDGYGNDHGLNAMELQTTDKTDFRIVGKHADDQRVEIGDDALSGRQGNSDDDGDSDGTGTSSHVHTRHSVIAREGGDRDLA